MFLIVSCANFWCSHTCSIIKSSCLHITLHNFSHISPLTLHSTSCYDTVGWVVWPVKNLLLTDKTLAVKTVPEMTCNVSRRMFELSCFLICWFNECVAGIKQLRWEAGREHKLNDRRRKDSRPNVKRLQHKAAVKTNKKRNKTRQRKQWLAAVGSDLAHVTLIPETEPG